MAASQGRIGTTARMRAAFAFAEYQGCTAAEADEFAEAVKFYGITNHQDFYFNTWLETKGQELGELRSETR